LLLRFEAADDAVDETPLRAAGRDAHPFCAVANDVDGSALAFGTARRRGSGP